MTMKIPFDPAAIYSFLRSRSCTKTLPEGSLPWPASLMNHVFLFILTAFSLYTSLNLFTLPQNSLFTIWCELSESRSDVSCSSTVPHVPCPWGHTPFIYRFELNSELSWSSVLFYLIPHLLSTLTSVSVENHRCSVGWISTGLSGLQWVRGVRSRGQPWTWVVGGVYLTLAFTVKGRWNNDNSKS